MKRLVVGVIGIFLVVAFLDLCWVANSPAEDAKKVNPAIERLIKTGTPTKRDFTLTCPWFGRVESQKVLRVAALANGEILDIKVPDETPVKKGTPLFRLGGPLVEGRLQALMAKMVALKKEIILARKTMALEEEGVRYQVTRKSTLLQARTRLATLQGALTQAKNALTLFRKRLIARARMDGLFTGRRVSKGQEVQAGETLCEIVSLKLLRIVATLFPPQGLSLKGLTAIIHTENGRNVTAPVAAVLPQHTRQGATRVWIEGKAVSHFFSPGQPVFGDLVLRVQKGVLAVPASAIIRDQNERPFIFVKGPKGYIKRPVKTGPVSHGYVGILSGLKETDKVVIRGGYELFYRQFNKIYKVAD